MTTPPKIDHPSPSQRTVICEVKIKTDLPSTNLENLTLWSRLFARLGVASSTYVVSAKTRMPKQKWRPGTGPVK